MLKLSAVLLNRPGSDNRDLGCCLVPQCSPGKTLKRHGTHISLHSHTGSSPRGTGGWTWHDACVDLWTGKRWGIHWDNQRHIDWICLRAHRLSVPGRWHGHWWGWMALRDTCSVCQGVPSFHTSSSLISDEVVGDTQVKFGENGTPWNWRWVAMGHRSLYMILFSPRKSM